VAPKGSGLGDYIGMFANTAGLGLEHLTAKYKAALDDYSFIMAEALADRLAEAVAEKVHEDVRRCDRFVTHLHCPQHPPRMHHGSCVTRLVVTVSASHALPSATTQTLQPPAAVAIR